MTVYTVLFTPSVPSQDLERTFSLQFERSVNRDNMVSFQNLSLQIERVRWRATLAGCQVVVHHHLDQTLSLTHGPHCLGRYTAQGEILKLTKMLARGAVEKNARWKSHQADFPGELGNPAKYAGFPLSHRHHGCWLTKTGHLVCYEKRTF